MGAIICDAPWESLFTVSGWIILAAHDIVNQVIDSSVLARATHKNGLEEFMQMENKLFRKKSLEKISSPEELHDYMQVTSPRLWMLLSAIAALLVGFIVYASTVTMENTMKIQVDVQFVDFTEEFQERPPELYSCVRQASCFPNESSRCRHDCPDWKGNGQSLICCNRGKRDHFNH